MTKRRHRRHSIPFKRMIVEAYVNGTALNALSVECDICRHLIHTWIEKYEKGKFDSETVEAEQFPEYEAQFAALERLVGRQALEIEFLKQQGCAQHRRQANAHRSLPGRWSLCPARM
ncbi:MAG: helix-turn-helix domain-containing protein [Roseibium sp.]|uniref:helix-turn-helix domain-containing protein n=1 Tax=Roseibium sp. TaxID=1936156 RepID=UPI0026249C07|nr:helix-turn-helix domain-containing protein [Roseibium sp.]MCV0424161.1 helix-turn-helix domain-containing protein [Roseibium sp.]